MAVEKREIEIEWEGKPAKVVIKELTYGERNDIRNESNEIKLMGDSIQTKVNMGRFQELCVLKSVVSAPFKTGDISAVRDLPIETGDKIYKEVDRLNHLSEEKKES